MAVNRTKPEEINEKLISGMKWMMDLSRSKAKIVALTGFTASEQWPKGAPVYYRVYTGDNPYEPKMYGDGKTITEAIENFLTKIV